MKANQAILAVSATAAVPAMAAKTLLPLPPMGFNNWARFECKLNQTLFTQTADAMAANGLLAAGYDRINIDDCWSLHNRTSKGVLQWDPKLFPQGLPWLASYVKQKGFHFGIYSDAGNLTCGGYPGSLNYEEIDAATFESWGVDYLKLDGCWVDPFTEARYREIYSHWHTILDAMDQPLIFSESAPAYFSGDEAGNNTDWYTVMDWVPGYGELARHSDDIPTFGTKTAWGGVMTNYRYNTLLARHQKPGFYNDPDFLIADHPKLTLTEVKAQFALWCSFSAPLIISAWVPALSKDVLDMLKNERLLAVNQDPLALQATLVSRDDKWDVLTKSLSNGDRVLTILNKQDQAGSSTLLVPFERVGYGVDASGTTEYKVTDLWTGASSNVRKGVSAVVPSHGVASYRISPRRLTAYDDPGSESSPVVPTGMVFNTKSLRCLTTANNGVSLQTCNASDGQVWRMNSDGTLCSLASAEQCVSAEDGKVALAACNSAKEQQWYYSSTGNIRNVGTGLCVSEADNGALALVQCGLDANRQVFEMPSGSLRE